jgi:FtsZ-binding cell division protein ZapB
LNKMEVVLKQEEDTIGLLRAKAQELMEKAKELYAAAEAHADANIKTQEDLNG